MRVPISWLRDYVDLPTDAQEISDRLASVGFPVAEIVRRPPISGVIVGRISALEKHPNADRLQVGTIDVGKASSLTIATAATNVAQGQVIPVATIGAQLPLLKIERRKMRGLESEGMMCSADELALPPEWFEDGIMQLDSSVPLGADVVDFFGLADDILDVEITSNRVDAMSILGLARELAASYGVALRVPSFTNPGTGNEPQGTAPRITIRTTGCSRFIAQRFDDVIVAPAPSWMRIRLALAGQRPINNVVDISNYVMFELGEPLHFYDAERVKASHLIVRDAIAGEKLQTLDGSQHTLAAQSLVIADEDHPLGLAGLMGGADSEIHDTTRAIILEAANFEGARIRRMSAQIGLRTEASSRHEKSLAPALADMGAARAAQLLEQIGARAYAPHEAGTPLTEASEIFLEASDVERLLGLRLDLQRIASHLERLGFAIALDGARLKVRPPSWRRDVTIQADLIEEVARMEGYDNIVPVEPDVPAHAISSAQYVFENRVADALATLGYHELITYSLHGKDIFERSALAGIEPTDDAVEVRNPLSEDQRYLRTTLGGGLIKYLARIDRPARIFEIGHVFTRDGAHVSESTVVTFGFSAEPTAEPAWQDSQFLRLKGDCEEFVRDVCNVEVVAVADSRRGLHPGKTAVLLHGGREIANLGKLHPRVQRAFDVRLPAYMCNIYLDALPDYAVPVYHAPTKYPTTARDLALIVPLDVTAARITEITRHAMGRLCMGVRVFDEYRGPQIGEGLKSVAVRAVIGRSDATITDDEAEETTARAVAALRDELGASIRE